MKLRSGVLFLGVALTTCLGCGNDLPANGTSGNAVNLEQAKEQGKSMADYYKANPKAIQRSDPNARR